MSDKDRTPEEPEEKDEEKAAAEAEAEDAAPARANAKERDEGEDGEDAAPADEGAARIAEALGVGEEKAGEAEGEAEGEEAKPAPNRAARRRDEAVARRRRKVGDKPSEGAPKDKNARAKELLSRRQEQAASPRPVALLPSEMVEDALSRITSGAGRWIRKNFHIIQWVIVGAAVATGGVLFYISRVEKTEGTASGTLADAVAADRGKVLAEDKRSDEEKELDPSRVFKSADERADTALAAYNKVIDEHAGSGAAILAKLGQAGVMLDKKDYAHALEAFSAVASSTLAGADPDVKGRALEGLGFAKEGKGDLDGALATFKEIEAIDAKGFKELGLYHQARILIAKKETEKAKELLKSVREKLQAPSADGRPFQFLEAVVDETLRKLDPSAVPARPQLGGPKGSSMSPEEIERLLKKARENAEKKKNAGDEHE